MTWEAFDDDADPACIDCALGNCTTCLGADRAPEGERSCCCGRESDATPWDADFDFGDDEPDDERTES